MLTKCPICSSLMSSHAYESHRYVHDSTDRSFMCERGCMDMFFETVDELEMHDEFMHVFSICKTQFERSNLFEITNELHLDVNKRRPKRTKLCTICARNIPLHAMHRHMRVHSPTGRPFACARGCSQTYFITQETLSDHSRKVHHIMAETTCNVCGVEDVKPNLAQHMLTHDPTGRPFQCTDGCVETFFQSKSAHGRHRRTVHNKVTVALSQSNCLVCAKTCASNTMWKHMVVHNSEGRPFKCDNGCKETFFISKRNLHEHEYRFHKADSLQVNKIASTPSEVTTADASDVTVSPTASSSVEPTVTPTALRSINTPTVQTMVKLEPTSPMAKRPRISSTKSCDKTTSVSSLANSSCTVCGKFVKSNRKLHMKVHKPSDYPCTLGCVKTFASSANALKFHNSQNHQWRQQTTTIPRESSTTSSLLRSPSSSSAASESESESSSDNSDDDNWRAPRAKMLKRTVLRKSTAHLQRSGPTAISTPLSRVSRKRKICTVSPIVRAEDVHEEGVTVEKSVLTSTNNVVQQPLVSTGVENKKLSRPLAHDATHQSAVKCQ